MSNPIPVGQDVLLDRATRPAGRRRLGPSSPLGVAGAAGLRSWTYDHLWHLKDETSPFDVIDDVAGGPSWAIGVVTLTDLLLRQPEWRGDWFQAVDAK